MRQAQRRTDAERSLTAAATAHLQTLLGIEPAQLRLVNHRTALVAQMRGLLLDRGIAFAQSITRARREIRILLEDTGSDLSDLFRSMLAQLYACLLGLDRQIAWFDRSGRSAFGVLARHCRSTARPTTTDPSVPGRLF